MEMSLFFFYPVQREVAVMSNQTQAERGGAVQAVYEWLEALGTAIIIAMVLFTFVIRVNEVRGDSMLPNYTEGTRVIVQTLGYRPAAGDVVVIDATHTPLDEFVIKRVIATEGQTVDFDAFGTVLVDGEPLDESAYIENGITTHPPDYTNPLTVPPGHLFVLGDNRAVSNDSRSSAVGMIDERYVLGKAEFVVFPFSRFGKIL